MPFNGEVCPFCQRDKSSDEAATVWITVALVFGGFIGNAVGGFGGMIIGGFGLAIVAGIMIGVGAAKKGHSARKPPRVRVDSSWNDPPQPKQAPALAPAPASPKQVDAVARLKRLDQLKADGVLTDEERQRQRAAIVATL